MNIGLKAICRSGCEKEAESPFLFIDSQSIKLAPFVSEERSVDGNKMTNRRKRQVLVDTVGLVWGVAVNAINGSDHIYVGLVVLEIKGVLQRLKSILIDKFF